MKDKDHYYTLAAKNHHNQHWSRFFYDHAKQLGYKYAVRQHLPNFVDGDPTLHPLRSKDEMWSLPFIKNWEECEVCKIGNIEHPDFDHWEIKDYTDYGEKLLIAHFNDKTHWVVAYLMDLEEYRADEKKEGQY